MSITYTTNPLDEIILDVSPYQQFTELSKSK